jgi:hypothetical protein
MQLRRARIFHQTMKRSSLRPKDNPLTLCRTAEAVCSDAKAPSDGWQRKAQPSRTRAVAVRCRRSRGSNGTLLPPPSLQSTDAFRLSNPPAFETLHAKPLSTCSITLSVVAASYEASLRGQRLARCGGGAWSAAVARNASASAHGRAYIPSFELFIVRVVLLRTSADRHCRHQ